MNSAFGVPHNVNKGLAPLLKKPELLHRRNAKNYLADGQAGAAAWEAKYAGAKTKFPPKPPMKVLFGKRKVVNEHLRPILPSTTTAAYDNSQYDKKKAAVRNLGAKAAGAAAGFGGAYLGYRATKGKIKFLAKDTRIPFPGKKVPFFLSAEKKQGIAASTATGTGSTVLGYAASKKSLDKIKKDPKYRYRES